jgi:hypothetical protein
MNAHLDREFEAQYEITSEEYYMNEYDDGFADEMEDGPEEPEDFEPFDGFTDAMADADTLASCGWGTDEDYGYYGEDY